MEKKSKHGCSRGRRVQQLQALLFTPDCHAGYAGHICPRMVEAADKPDLDWICTDRKHNRDFCGRGFGGERGRTAEGGYQCDLAIDQVSGKLGQSGIIAFRRMVLDRQVLVSGEAFNLQSFVKGRKL